MTIENYYDNDFPHEAAANTEFYFTINETTVKVKGKALIPINGESRVLVFYIPKTLITFIVINEIIDNYENIQENFNSTTTSGGTAFEIKVGSIRDFKNTYSKQFYIYFEYSLSNYEIKKINNRCIDKQLIVGLRGLDYQRLKTNFMKPIAFISHDSRDKESIARIIFSGLDKRLIPIWFDEYSLSPGDSLRESIELRLKNSKKCILILSTNFLNNTGWTKKEFDSIFSRELIKNEKVIIPIWVGITSNDVYEYSPSLSDKVALVWPSDNLDEESYKRQIEELISKLHLALLK